MAARSQQVKVILPAFWSACSLLQRRQSWPVCFRARSLLYPARDKSHLPGSLLLLPIFRQLSSLRASETVTGESGRDSITGARPLGLPSPAKEVTVKSIPELRSKQGSARVTVSSKEGADIAEVINNLKKKLSDKKVNAAADLPELVGFFVNIGLSKADIVGIFIMRPSLLKSHTNVDVRPKFDLLISHGVKQSDIVSTIRAFPNFLRSQHFGGTVRYILSLGVRQQKLGRMMVLHPGFWSRTEHSLASIVDLLRGPEIGIVDVGRLFERYPQVLRMSVPTLRARWKYLQTLLPEADLAKLVLVQPNILSFGQKNSDNKVACLMRIFKRHDNVANMIARCPQLLAYSAVKMEANLSHFKKLFSEADALRILLMAPSLLGHSWTDSIQPKLDFLINVIGLDLLELVDSPMYLSFSLSDRIKPRTEVLLAAGYRFRKRHDVPAQKGNQKVVSLHQALYPVNNQFAKRFGGSASDERPPSGKPWVRTSRFGADGLTMALLMPRKEAALVFGPG